MAEAGGAGANETTFIGGAGGGLTGVGAKVNSSGANDTVTRWFTNSSRKK